MNPIQIQQLLNHLNWQTHKLMQIERSIQDVLREINSLKKEQKPTVDKIEYNFDQLKIEKLEGTLNIGITPSKGNSLEDFIVNGKPLVEHSKESMSENKYFTSIQSTVNNYLDAEVPLEIQRQMKEYHFSLEYENQMFIIADIRKQVDDRILHYLGQLMRNEAHTDLEPIIVDKLKHDILSGLNQYLSNLYGSEVNPNEFYGN